MFALIPQRTASGRQISRQRAGPAPSEDTPPVRNVGTCGGAGGAGGGARWESSSLGFLGLAAEPAGGRRGGEGQSREEPKFPRESEAGSKRFLLLLHDFLQSTAVGDAAHLLLQITTAVRSFARKMCTEQ